ncbi:MAG: RluA family pseudouridine synthase [Minisyncoccota bacterium]
MDSTQDNTSDIADGVLPVEVLYKDADFVVLCKPAGLVVHTDGHTNEATLSDWVLAHYPEVRGVGESVILSNGSTIEKHGIVHRLDRETSGAIVVALTQKSFLFLKKQFQDRTVQKAYRAFVYGMFDRDDGIINAPIGRSTRDFRKYTVGGGVRGAQRNAETAYRVIRTCGGFSYIEAFPHTGRTHQIRVHMNSIQHPIVCDKLYAKGRVCALGFSRTALHSLWVEFTLPTGRILHVDAPLPKDFIAAVAELETMC